MESNQVELLNENELKSLFDRIFFQRQRIENLNLNEAKLLQLKEYIKKQLNEIKNFYNIPDNIIITKENISDYIDL